MKKNSETGIPERWEELEWGDIATLVYGKGLRNYSDKLGRYPVYGTNGQIGYCDECLSNVSGVIIGRKGAYRGVHYSKDPFGRIPLQTVNLRNIPAIEYPHSSDTRDEAVTDSQRLLVTNAFRLV